MGSSRMGCEYHYRFSVEDELIPKYPWHEDCGRRYVFEIRTNFVVKGRFENIDGGGGGGVDEEVIGSEVFSVGLFEWEKEEKEVNEMDHFVGNRLRDYWMSDDEVGEFIRKALSFADKKNGPKMIPIGVDIDVCSVQQEGEPISATLARAIQPECLYPISLCPRIQISNYPGEGGDAPDLYHMEELRSQSTARVVDDGVMDYEECVVCLRRPIVGSQVTTLKCGHAFHYHCIAKWLASKDTCPTCRQQAHDAFVKSRELGGL